MKFTREEKIIIKAARKKIQEWKKSQENEYSKLLKTLNIKSGDQYCSWLKDFLFIDDEMSVKELENLMRVSYITEVEKHD